MTTDIDDIVESLVATSYALPGDYSVDPPRNICTEAADLIASLRATLATVSKMVTAISTTLGVPESVREELAIVAEVARAPLPKDKP